MNTHTEGTWHTVQPFRLMKQRGNKVVDSSREVVEQNSRGTGLPEEQELKRWYKCG